MKKHLSTIALIMAVNSANAQTTVITQPLAVNTGNASGTIASSGTYQQIWAADTSSRGRAGCTVVNYGTHTMYIFAGAIASATHAKSIQIAPNQPFYCSTGNGGVLKDQISIDGTTAEAFYAGIQ